MATKKKVATPPTSNEKPETEELPKEELVETKEEEEVIDENFLDSKDDEDEPALDPPVKSEAEINALPKVNQRNFGPEKHEYRTFSARFEPGLENPQEALESGDIWDFVASHLNMFDEIRALDIGGRWIAYLLVVFKHGKKVRCKVLSFHELEKVSYKTFTDESKFEVALRGPNKWCVVEVSNGNVIKEGLPTRGEAYNYLDRFLARFNR